MKTLRSKINESVMTPHDTFAMTKNNELVKKMFKGDTSAIQDLCPNAVEILQNDIKNISIQMNELFSLANKFKNRSLAELTAGLTIELNGMHKVATRSFTREKLHKFLNSGFYQTIFEFLDKRGILMLDPSITSDLYAFQVKLSKPLSVEDNDELFYLLESKDFAYKIGTYQGSTKVIYPFPKR